MLLITSLARNLVELTAISRISGQLWDVAASPDVTSPMLSYCPWAKSCKTKMFRDESFPPLETKKNKEELEKGQPREKLA